MKEFMTVKELAERLRVSRSHIYQMWPRWVDEYKLNIIRIDRKGSLLFPKKEIEKMLKSWRVKE